MNKENKGEYESSCSPTPSLVMTPKWVSAKVKNVLCHSFGGQVRTCKQILVLSAPGVARVSPAASSTNRDEQQVPELSNIYWLHK